MATDPISTIKGRFTPQTKVKTSTQETVKENFSKVIKGLEPGSTPPTQSNPEPMEYVVKPGDTLWKIGKQLFKKDPLQIAKENGISNPNLIHPGQKLLIYSSSSQTTQPLKEKELTASWYGSEYHNKPTASGERFDMYRKTLAHKSLPFGTKVRLINPENGKVAEGVVNDRGPFINNRQVDVSYALAKQLGFVKKGVTKLTLEII